MCAGRNAGFWKSGGFIYIDEDNFQVRVAYRQNSSTVALVGVRVPCRAMDIVSDELKPFCTSSVLSDRPGWYLVHRDGYFYFEPEYDPTNPDTFDIDASFVIRNGVFFDGFGSMTLLDQANHYGVAGLDDTVRAVEFRNTPEFKDSASLYSILYSTKGESTGV